LHHQTNTGYSNGEAILSQKIPLGATDIMIPEMGIGAWAWGDNYWGNMEHDSLEDYQAVLDSIVN